MDYSIISRLEDLPVEVLMEIFIYFTADQIYFSFAQLNHRLNFILKSLPNLIIIVHEHPDPFVLSFFYSWNQILIRFRRSLMDCQCQSHAINGGNRLFEIYPTLDDDWYSPYLNYVENIIRSEICSRLQSLVLPATSPELTQLIFRGAFACLKLCHLGQCESIILQLSTTIQLQNFRQLTIREQNGCELEAILLICSSLVYLDFSCIDVIPRFLFTDRCFPAMKYLRLGRLKNFFFHTGQFDFLLSLFPNLFQFHLTADQCHGNVETIKFREIAHDLRHRCPLLKILMLRIYMQVHMHSPYGSDTFRELIEMHPLFNYIFKCESLIMITSHGFIQHHVYMRRYARPSSK